MLYSQPGRETSIPNPQRVFYFYIKFPFSSKDAVVCPHLCSEPES